MRIVMKTSIAGANWSARAGQEIEMIPAEAKRLINAGYAVEVALAAGVSENAALRTRPPLAGRGKEKRNGKLD